MNYTSLNNTLVEDTSNLHFVLIDCSVYNPDLALPLTFYDIFLPNYTVAKTLQYVPYQNTIVNSTQLGITTWDNYVTLVDGLWTIKQWYAESANPDICLGYKIKNYFRIINTKNQILTKIQTALENCDCKEVDKYYALLQDLELAKYMAENLCDTSRAIILYNGVKNKLQTCQTC